MKQEGTPQVAPNRLNTIINGDALDEMNKLEAESIDLIFADPPYWMRTEGSLMRVEGTEYDGCADEWDQFESLESYEQFTRAWLEACYRILKPDGSIWVIGGMQCIHTVGALMQQTGYWLINDVIWHKHNPTPNFRGTRLTNSHETLIWAAKSKKSRYSFHYKTAKELNVDTVVPTDYAKGVRKQLGSVWKFPVCSGGERMKDDEGNKLHSTQKPQELLERIIAISSHWGDTVLDPFGGTMTTAAAAIKLGRNYLMIERDRRYCTYGEKRLRGLRSEDTPLARAVYDEKPLRVSVRAMIESGALAVGEWFYLEDGRAVTQLHEDGKLAFEGTVLDMHTAAAIAKNAKAKRLNGFDCWYVKREETLIPLSTVRDAYRDSLTDTGLSPDIDELACNPAPE
jgi:site-specific DNA-methyltransferase (adenine-specific)